MAQNRWWNTKWRRLCQALSLQIFWSLLWLKKLASWLFRFVSLCWMVSLVFMATASNIWGRCSWCLASSVHAGSAQHFVVQANHKWAELTDAHKVAAEDVDSARLTSRPLLTRPAKQQRERPRGQFLHVLEGMEEDVRNIFCQVQTADVKTSWKTQWKKISVLL